MRKIQVILRLQLLNKSIETVIYPLRDNVGIHALKGYFDSKLCGVFYKTEKLDVPVEITKVISIQIVL